MRFVIEQHVAHRVQYDLRLEMPGRIQSWYFFRGLPATAGDRCVAIEATELPREANDPFEGAIATPNQQPAGAVMVWDRGRYTIRGHGPSHALRRGKILLTLAGEKCTGSWTLERIPSRSGARAAWLVIKNGATGSRPAVRTEGRHRSVLSGRTIDEIAAASWTVPNNSEAA